MTPFLEKYWKEVCARDFPRQFPEKDETWLEFYHRQLDSTKSRIQAAGSRLRDSYRGEGKTTLIMIHLSCLERKVHQLQTITVAPKRTRSASLSITSKQTGSKRISLMEKSRQEAMNSSTRTSNKSPSKSVVTFRMRQPSQKR